jgi:hypothetical protein
LCDDGVIGLINNFFSDCINDMGSNSGVIMNDGFEGVWKEEVVAYFKALSQNLLQDKQEKPLKTSVRIAILLQPCAFIVVGHTQFYLKERQEMPLHS